MELTRNKFIEILYFFAKLIRKFLKYVISQKNPKQKIKKNKIKKIFIAKFIKFKKNYKSIICQICFLLTLKYDFSIVKKFFSKKNKSLI